MIQSTRISLCTVSAYFCHQLKNGAFETKTEKRGIIGHHLKFDLKHDPFDVLVVGGGVVGLSIAREASISGLRVICLEKDDTIGNGASGGNSGLGCTGYDAPPNSLESKLLRRSIRRHQNIYRSFGLSHEHVRKCGSLVVAWDQEQLSKLSDVVQENRDAGDEDAQLISKEELADIEPYLSQNALGAVLCPYEAVVEPWLIPIGYAESSLRHGAHISLSTQLTKAVFNEQNKMWEITAEALPIKEHVTPTGRSLNGEVLSNHCCKHQGGKNELLRYEAKVVVNCAGVFGDVIESFRCRGIPSYEDENASEPFQIIPRKGQFAVFRRTVSDSSCQRQLEHIIEPVASEFTKGVIVWETLHGNIVVGPTAEPQTSKDDRSTDAETINTLHAWGGKVFPKLLGSEWSLQGSYACLRPATQYRDYQIKTYPRSQWITVGGIRSTGLSACSGIAEHVNGLLGDQAAAAPPVIGVSESASTPIKLPIACHPNPPVPSLASLAEDYNQACDGTVEVYGRRWRVTHPITSFGFETKQHPPFCCP